MSLEAAIQENTQVMRELIARLTSASTTAVTMTGAEYVSELDKADKTRPANAAEAVADAKERAAVTAAATKAKKDQEALLKEKGDTAIDYEKQVRPLLVKVSTAAGRDTLVKLLADFGVTKGDQLKPAQFADAMAAASKILEEAEV